jgi:hypothetical protein
VHVFLQHRRVAPLDLHLLTPARRTLRGVAWDQI